MTMKQLTEPLDAEIADRLLDLLSTDDSFRARFQEDHLSALSTLGYAPPKAQMTACGLTLSKPEPFADCKVHDLASKEVISSARSEIKAMLVKGLAHNVPQLDAALSSERRSLK